MKFLDSVRVSGFNGWENVVSEGSLMKVGETKNKRIEREKTKIMRENKAHLALKAKRRIHGRD